MDVHAMLLTFLLRNTSSRSRADFLELSGMPDTRLPYWPLHLPRPLLGPEVLAVCSPQLPFCIPSLLDGS